jgi:TPR repeat protein
VLQDYKKALSLYKQAARLGSDQALHSLGIMYEDGKGCTADEEVALEYYERAARNGKGVGMCYLSMADLFLKRKEFTNAEKCWGKFFVSDAFKLVASSPTMSSTAVQWGVDYLEKVTKYGLPIRHLSTLLTIKDQIFQYADDAAKRYPTSRCHESLQLVKDTLFQEQETLPKICTPKQALPPFEVCPLQSILSKELSLILVGTLFSPSFCNPYS